MDSLVTAGLARDVTIRGAPYDFRSAQSPVLNSSTCTSHLLCTCVRLQFITLAFRYAPNSGVGQQWQKDLLALIEDTYVRSGNQSVVLVAHSMGCIYSLYFLNQQPITWKSKYLAKFVPISGTALRIA